MTDAKFRRKIIDRDVCCIFKVNCNGENRNEYLSPHHILRKKIYPNARHDLRNAVTACGLCHVSFAHKEINLAESIAVNHLKNIGAFGSKEWHEVKNEIVNGGKRDKYKVD